MDPIIKSLTELHVPQFLDAQIDQFQLDKIHAEEVGRFDPQEAYAKLKNLRGKRAVGIDIGGNKLISEVFSVDAEARIVIEEGFGDLKKDGLGVGYLASMESAAAYAKAEEIPAGISIGIPLDGSKPEDSNKLPVLLKELKEKYGGDFANLFTVPLACLNDGPAGLMSGAIEAHRVTEKVNTVILLINGGGIGAAVLKDGVITETLAGHVPVIPELNIYGASRPCGVFDAMHVCMENVGSNERGIEQIWEQKTGTHLSAVEIEKQFTGNQPDGALSLELYDYSALILAYTAKGLAKTFGINLSDPAVAVVCHGGAFKFPDYGNRVRQILQNNGNATVNLLLTKDYSQNACVDGAAIAALLKS